MTNTIEYKPNRPKTTVDPGMNIILTLYETNVSDSATISNPDNSWLTHIHTFCGANWSFKEWNTAPDGTGTSYNPGDEVSGDVTLYAIWEPLEVKPETMDLRDNDLLYKINLLTDAERAKIVAALTQHQDISGKADNGAIADEYDAATVYSEGDRCTKAGKYYSRKSWGADTPAAETWDSTHWDEICVDDLITAEAGARAAADTAINQAAAKQKATVGIVEDGNTATQAISAGQYVIWKGDLYTADSNISSGETLASSGGSKNLTAVSGGGLNSLNSKIDKFKGQQDPLAVQAGTITAETATTNIYEAKAIRVGRFAFIAFNAKGTYPANTETLVASISNFVVPTYNVRYLCAYDEGGATYDMKKAGYCLWSASNGKISVNCPTQAKAVGIMLFYIIN